MDFEWDEEKEFQNLLKHKIEFLEAMSVWSDAYASEFLDENNSDFELRMIRIGFSNQGRILFIVFTERFYGQKIRIISARKATKKEILFYER